MLTGKPTGKRPLGRPRRRWEDNIRKGLKEIGINMRNWVDLAQDRDYWRILMNAVLNLRFPYTMELLKSTEKRSLQRLRHKWEDCIRMDLKEIGVNTWNWVDLTQDRDWRALLNTPLNLRVP